jgi:hypothetical protein
MISLDITNISNYIKKNFLQEYYEEDLVEEFEELKKIIDKSYRNSYYFYENKEIINSKLNILKNTIERNDKMFSMLSILDEDFQILNKKIKK